ncbi:MAG: hypothetical protein R3Y04_03710 [Rikenellaceae bacterium]
MENGQDKQPQDKTDKKSAEEAVSRYPLAFAGKNADFTILKHMYIFQEHEAVKRKIRETFPELAEYLPKRYYYMIVADRLGLSKSYVNVVVTKVKKMSELNYKKQGRNRQ